MFDRFIFNDVNDFFKYGKKKLIMNPEKWDWISNLDINELSSSLIGVDDFLMDLSFNYLLMNNPFNGMDVVCEMDCDRVFIKLRKYIDELSQKDCRMIGIDESKKENIKPPMLVASLKTLSVRYIAKNKNSFFKNDDEKMNLPLVLQEEIQKEMLYIESKL
jgi:hypothetical protein